MLGTSSVTFEWNAVAQIQEPLGHTLRHRQHARELLAVKVEQQLRHRVPIEAAGHLWPCGGHGVCTPMTIPRYGQCFPSLRLPSREVAYCQKADTIQGALA